jgi:nucleoid-associated protein YgaU
LFPFAGFLGVCLDKCRNAGKQRANLSELKTMTIHIKWQTISGVGLGACLVLLCCAPVFGQSLGDVARQERQRKEQQASRSLHVYTNDDLRKAKILVPEDQARALAARNNPNNPMPAPVELAGSANAIAPLQFLLPVSTGENDIKDPSTWEPEPVASEISPALAADSVDMEVSAASIPVKTNERREPVRRREFSKVADPFAPKRIERHETPAPVAIEPVHVSRKAVASIASVLGSSATVTIEPVHASRKAAASIAPALGSSATVTIEPVHATRKFNTAGGASFTSSTIMRERAATSSNTDKVLVRPGDSLWKLAQRYLGNGNRWFDLAELNPQLESPNLIRAGEWIQVRPSSEDESTKQVVVRSGDTLWSVAENELGSPRGVECIVEANPQLESSDLIRPGQKLLLPANCGVAR